MSIEPTHLGLVIMTITDEPLKLLRQLGGADSNTKGGVPRFWFTTAHTIYNGGRCTTVIPCNSGRLRAMGDHLEAINEIKEYLTKQFPAVQWIEFMFGGEEYFDGITDSSYRWQEERTALPDDAIE